MRPALPLDLERAVLAPPEEPIVEVAPEAPPLTPWEWIRKNLFSGWFNAILTLLTAAFILVIGYRLGRWLFVTSDWTVLKVNLRRFMVGRFPPEEIWRVWVSLYLVVILAGLSRGVLVRTIWTLRRVLARVVAGMVLVLLLLWLLESAGVWTLIGGATAAFGIALGVGRWVGGRLRLPLLIAWVLSFPAVVLILRLAGGVEPEQWGGFLLNILVAVVAIFVSFPVGLLLALGRRSELPAVRGFSVGFIELVRGVPLVILLIFAVFVLDLLMPPGMDLPLIVRAMIIFVIFSAAYVAEIVRGGLQGVPQGQYEAARGLGLSTTRMMGLVILPQALRSTIPAMISHFISLFKDTSLLAAFGIFSDLLFSARKAATFQFIGSAKEALLSAALVFLVVAFSMSRWSQRLERRVGLGER